MRYTKSEIALTDNLTIDTVLKCATPDFREKVIAIKTADTLDKLKEAIANFYSRYGTGYISKLHLGSLGVFKGTATYSSTYKEQWISQN